MICYVFYLILDNIMIYHLIFEESTRTYMLNYMINYKADFGNEIKHVIHHLELFQ